MLTEADLIFLDGWIRKIYILPEPVIVTKNNAAVVVDLDFEGFFHSVLFTANDSKIKMTLTLNQAETSNSIQHIYEWGYTKPNSSMPYIGTYRPTNGTAGYYTLIWTPSVLIPVKRRFYVKAILEPDSTQDSAWIDIGLAYYLIYDMDAFKKSFKEYLSSVLPKEASKYQPISPTPVIPPSESNKYNPFEYIP